MLIAESLREVDGLSFESVRGYMRALLDRGVPGCELAVCRDGGILFHEFAGYSDAERSVPCAAENRYFIYSCTKPVTATAAMRGLELGLFGLDDPVAKYLPAYADAFVMENGARVPARTMTIRHLMTMTAGFDYDLNTAPLKALYARSEGKATTIDIASALIEQPLRFQPGERFQYSLCLDVMGAVIEAAAGMTLAEFDQKYIFDPLGMKDTYFWTPGTVDEKLAAQYVWDEEAKRVKLLAPVNDLIPTTRFCSGGAGLVSTASDYLKLVNALACGGAPVLKKESVDLMRAEQIPEYRASGNFTCTCGPDYGYGLGVRTRVRFDEGARSGFGELGWDGAAGMDVMADPENRLSFVFAMHVRNWPAMLGPVHLQLRDLIYPALGL